MPPAPGDKKTVINAPFGLASLTITTNRKNSSTANESGKPCNPETENIETNNDIQKPYHGGSSDTDTLGGKGGAFFGPPHPPPYSDYGPPPPPPHDFHHPYPHYPPPPSHHHHFHHYPPPPPHHHHPDCHHGEDFPSFTSTTKLPLIPEKKPDGKFTSTVVPKDIIPQQTQSTTSTQRTTENVDALIDDIFGGPNSSSSTTSRNNIDVNNQEQTGEGNLDIRMPGSH